MWRDGANAAARDAGHSGPRGATRIRQSRPERAAEEGQRAVPRVLRPHRVVLNAADAAGAGGSLVGETVMGEVAVELGVHAGLLEDGLQLVDVLDREELVLRRPVAEHRRGDLARVDVLQ